MNKALRYFIKENFDFYSLKKIGFYPNEMKFNDYEGQAKLICTFFGFESIYDYGKHEIRGHISYEKTSSVNDKGELESEPFITTIFPNQMHI